jgi:cation-transporting ATPase G
MADACCGPTAPPAAGEAGERAAGSATSFWAITEVRFALVAGLLLSAGLISAAADAAPASDVLFLGALAIGGWTFIPEALRGLATGRLGVGTLMTIAAIGAVILGELGEAASLAFLFSI